MLSGEEQWRGERKRQRDEEGGSETSTKGNEQEMSWKAKGVDIWERKILK